MSGKSKEGNMINVDEIVQRVLINSHETVSFRIYGKDWKAVDNPFFSW